MWPGERVAPALAHRLTRNRVPGDARVRLMTGLALASAAALLVTVVLVTDRGPEIVPRAEADVVRVGVVDGQSVSGYLRSSRGELESMQPAAAPPVVGDTWALVSLTSYYAPDVLAGVLGGAAVAEVYAKAPIEGVRTQVVRLPVYRMPQDVVAGMLNAALARDQEQADYRKLAAELRGDGAAEDRLLRAYDTAARAAASEAAAFRAKCACLFAAVVRAGPAALDRIASRAEVRVVDPAPEVRSLDHTEFRPVLPEQKTETTASPSPSPVAGESSAPVPSSSGEPVTSASPQESVTKSKPAVTTPVESASVPATASSEPQEAASPAPPRASQDTSGR
jgi:hypothetical protein